MSPKIKNNFDTEYTLWQLPGKNCANVGIIAKSNSGFCFVIDGGDAEDAENLEKFIKDNCAGRVDAWFITHISTRFAGALLKLLKGGLSGISIEKIVYSHLIPEEAEPYDAVCAAFAEDFNLTIKGSCCQKIDVRTGERIKLDRAIVRVFSAADTGITEDFVNNRGVVYKFNLCCSSLLYMGNLAKEAATKLLENHKNELSCDILQIPGGGTHEIPEDIFKLTSPDTCLWNISRRDWDNNPQIKSIVEFLDALGATTHLVSCENRVNEIKITY